MDKLPLHGWAELYFVEAAHLRRGADKELHHTAVIAGEQGKCRDAGGLEQGLSPAANLAALDLDIAENDLKAVGLAAGYALVGEAPVFQLVEADQLKAALVEHFVVVYVLVNFRQDVAFACDRAVKGYVFDLAQKLLFSDWQAGQHRASVHVHEVITAHQLFDLPERHPAVAGQDFDVLINFYDYISVAFFVEPRRLLGLDLVNDDFMLCRIYEPIEIRRTLAAVLLGEVGLCGLYGRGNLNFVDVPRLDFRLHEVVGLAVEVLADYAEIADFVLHDDGLLKHGLSVHGFAQSLHGEKTAVFVGDLAASFVVEPKIRVGEAVLLYRNVDGFIQFVYPGQQLGCGVQGHGRSPHDNLFSIFCKLTFLFSRRPIFIE